MTRPSWEDYFLALAETVATRAACTRSQVGAVLVSQDRHVLGVGYNGAPPGALECSDGGCPRGLRSAEEVPPLSAYEGPGECVALHAEVNALAHAYTDVRGAVCYVTREPCSWCAKVLRAFGVARWVTREASAVL